MSDWNPEIFQKRLKQTREAKNPGVGVSVVSQLMKFGKETLRRYENGESEPCLSSLAAIADYYHVSVDYLMGRTNY